MPIRFELTPGQAHDAPPCKTLLDKLQPGQHVLADKAYDADWIRGMIWEQGAIDVIPPKSNRKLPAEFDAEIYRERNKIERFFRQAQSLIPTHRNPLRENVTKLPIDDQAGICQSMDRVLCVGCQVTRNCNLYH